MVDITDSLESFALKKRFYGGILCMTDFVKYMLELRKVYIYVIMW